MLSLKLTYQVTPKNNNPLEKEVCMGNHPFLRASGYVSFGECIVFNLGWKHQLVHHDWMRRWTNREGGAPLRALYIIWHCQDDVFLKNDGRSLYFSLVTKGFVSKCHFSIPNCEVDVFSLWWKGCCVFFFAQKHAVSVIFRPFHREFPCKSIPTIFQGCKSSL